MINVDAYCESFQLWKQQYNERYQSERSNSTYQLLIPCNADIGIRLPKYIIMWNNVNLFNVQIVLIKAYYCSRDINKS